MEFDELVKIRRSCRSYSEARISEDEIKEIITTAQLAPSWKNTQTGRYYVSLSDEAISGVFDALPEYNQRSSKNAAYIVTTFVTKLSGKATDGSMAEEGDLWGAYDLGLQNMLLMLKASELGYDTLVMGIRDAQALRKCFAIPEEEQIMSVISNGRKNGELGIRPRKQLDEILRIK